MRSVIWKAGCNIAQYIDIVQVQHSAFPKLMIVFHDSHPLIATGNVKLKLAVRIAYTIIRPISAPIVCKFLFGEVAPIFFNQASLGVKPILRDDPDFQFHLRSPNRSLNIVAIYVQLEWMSTQPRFISRFAFNDRKRLLT
jgi:hypothetical protein